MYACNGRWFGHGMRRDVLHILWCWVRTSSSAGQRAKCFRYRPAAREVEQVDKAFATVAASATPHALLRRAPTAVGNPLMAVCSGMGLTLYRRVRYPLCLGCHCRPMQPMASRQLAPKGMRSNESEGLHVEDVRIL